MLTVGGVRGLGKGASPDLIGGLQNERSELWASGMGHAVAPCATQKASQGHTQRGGQCIGFKALELVLEEVGIKGALRPVSLRETAASVLPRA